MKLLIESQKYVFLRNLVKFSKYNKLTTHTKIKLLYTKYNGLMVPLS